VFRFDIQERFSRKILTEIRLIGFLDWLGEVDRRPWTITIAIEMVFMSGLMYGCI